MHRLDFIIFSIAKLTMKHFLSFIFIILAASGLHAQGHQDPYKSVVDRITIGYNSANYKSIYSMFSPQFRQKISEAEFNTFMQNVSAYGKMASVEYSHDKEGFKVYKATMDNAVLSLIISLNELLLIDGFAITPYKAPLTGTPPDVLTTNNKATPLDLEVDKAVANFMDNPKNAGLSIAIIKDGQTQIYHYGETKKGSKRLPNNETIYEIGSITKTFTGILLAKAVEDQKLSLYDDVRKFLPAKCSDLAFGNHPIILRHLASHTAQLPRLPENFDQQPYFDPQNPYKNYNTDMLYDYLSTLQIKSMPGVTQDYSNLGMSLLGSIVAKAYDMDYDKLMKAYIAKPLKMNSTFVIVPDNKKDEFATGYYEGAETPYWDWSDLPGAGGIKSTLNDMVLYLKANMDNALPYIRFSHEPAFKKDNEATGLGWFINKTDTGTSMHWHNGGTYGFSSFLGYIREKNCGIVLLANSFTSGDLDTMGTYLLKYLESQ